MFICMLGVVPDWGVLYACDLCILAMMMVE